MSFTSTFSYFPSASQAKDIIRDFAGKQFPELDLKTATQDQIGAVIQKALEVGIVATSKACPVYSLRAHPLSLAQGGAQLCHAPSAVDLQSGSFLEPVLADSEHRTESHLAYYAEMEKVARDLLGPDIVHAWCLTHIIRRSGGSGAIGETAGPLRSVHNDYTEEFGDVMRKLYTNHPSLRGQFMRKMLKQHKGLELTAQEMGKYRIVVLNMWRPITAGPLRRDPLAVCDNRSIRRADLQRRRTDIGRNSADPNDDFALEVYLSQYSPEHKWHYVPDFTSQDLLVFKTYDSDMNPFIPTLHSAFDLPDQEGAPPRESCECRVFCLLPKTAVPASKL